MIVIGTLVASTGRTVNVSWYGKAYDGRRCADGSIFSHRNLKTRQLDLSREAFSRLADPDAGILKNVKVEVMNE